MHAVINESKLNVVTNCASRLSPELKQFVRRSMFYPFHIKNPPAGITEGLIIRLNSQLQNASSISTRNPTICPSIIVAGFRKLTRVDEMTPTEWIEYHNNNDHLPSLTALRKTCAKIAWEYKKVLHQTDRITASWCAGLSIETALKIHERRLQLLKNGEVGNVAIFGSFSNDNHDLETLRILSKMLKLEPLNEHEAITELIQKFTLAFE